jgi:hypothetical protein
MPDPETMEVDLEGVKITLPKEQAQQVIARRQAAKDETRKTADRLSALEAERKAADERAAAAETAKQAAEALRTGDIKRLEELNTGKLREERERLSLKLRDKHLTAALASNPKVVPQAVADATSLLRGQTTYDFDSDALIVLDATGQPLKDTSGKPIQVDTWLSGWLDQRPHFLADRTPPASGGKTGTPPAGAKTITSDEYTAATKDPARAQVIAQQIAAKQLVVV